MSKKPESELLLLAAVIAVAVMAVTVDFGALQQTYEAGLCSRLEVLRTVASLDRLLVHYLTEATWMG